VLLSVRFWSFALVAFGLVGALLALIGTLGGTAILLVALGAGASSGTFAVTVIRRLLFRSPSSGSTYAELVGKVGRVIVPIDGVPGKVRVELRGAWVDVVARAKEPIDTGETVIVEEVDGDAAVVSRAPRELTA
jgi:membrane protein implicated in regulation of membrane protease activity